MENELLIEEVEEEKESDSYANGCWGCSSEC